MTILEAIVLGSLQGLTEFLPISSTAHLRIAPALFGWSDPGAAFTAVTQIGTLFAVLIYFWKQIWKLGKAFLLSVRSLQPFKTEDSRLAWWILFGTIPISVCGLLFKNLIETSFRSLYVISLSLILLALVLVIAEKISKFNRNISSLRFLDTQIIGIAQALALIPGSSRSGTTITAGMLLNMNREAAASFSFLLSIPAVGLSGLYQLYKLKDALASDFGISLLVATIVAGVVGFVSIGFLLRFLRSHSTYVFVGYRIFLGGCILMLLYSNLVSP